MNLYFELTRFWALDPDRDVVYFDGQNWSFKSLEASMQKVVDFLKNNCSENTNDLIYIDTRSNWTRLVAILACIHQARLFITDCPTLPSSAYKIICRLSDYDSDQKIATPVHCIQYPNVIPKARPTLTLNSKRYQSENSLLRLAATSGTTGTPKWVPITVTVQLNRILESKERMGQLDSEANMFPCGASAWFARFFGGAKNGTLTCIETDAHKTLKFLDDHRYSTVYSSPDQLLYLIAAAREKLNFKPKIKSVTVCGGAITSSLSKAVSHYLGAFSISQYASTECGHIAQSDFEISEHGDCLAGQLSKYAQVRITDDKGFPLSFMQEGAVHIRSDYMAKGYQEFLTGKFHGFDQGWFDSGDMGYLTNDNKLVLTGRKADVVNIRGNKVNLQKVDSFFSEIPGILDAAAFLVRGEFDYPDVWVAVVLNKEIDPNDLQEKALNQLGYILAPSKMIQVKSIPRTITGKIKRHQITAMLEKSV